MSDRVVVLVHDDSLRKFVSLVLEQMNVAVDASGSVEATLKRIASDPPRMIVCKQRRGLIDCADVCRRLADDEATASIPIILLTADTRLSRQQGFMQSGGREVIQLPFTADELRAAIQRYYPLDGGAANLASPGPIADPGSGDR